ncbi:MAG: TIGR02757 family protein [Crocinitomicaceae bacterium]
MKKELLKVFLEEQTDRFNQTSFIQEDPISIPHLFENPKDIETIGFIVATISWGQRATIIKNGLRLCEIMGNAPYDYVMNASAKDLKDIAFVHRTFNAEDLRFFINSIRGLNQKYGGLEAAFAIDTSSMANRIASFRTTFLQTKHEKRSEKHVSNPLTGSASKRINMFLRWMVRNDNKGVDFGIWESISPSELYIPLDVHTGNVARELGLIKRKANDWKALEELMNNVRKFDSDDPCKYDYALFGIGVSGLLKNIK